MKVLVSDIDNSMHFDGNTKLTAAINKFTDEGNLFIVATDKPINYVVEELAFANIEPNYYICNNGAVIFDRFYNVLYRKDIKQDVVAPIVNMLKADDNILEVFIDTSHGFVSNTERSANGIVARPYDDVKAEMTLNSIVLKYPDIHGHINDEWINIIDIDADKATALNYLENHYRLDRRETYVVGKDAWDLEMMEKYNGYAYGNCSDDIKKYAKGSINSLEELIAIAMDDNQVEAI